MEPAGSGRRAGAGENATADRGSNGTGTFLAWIVAELAGFGLLVASVSDRQPVNCTGLCFTEREFLLYLGMVFGLWFLVAQVIAGLVLTTYFHRLSMPPVAAGSVAFFSTLVLVAVGLGCLGVLQR